MPSKSSGQTFIVMTVLTILLSGCAAGLQGTTAQKCPGQGNTFVERAYSPDYEFTIDWFSRNIPAWKWAMAPYVGRPGLQYLEVGMYEGRSVVWMLENVLTHPTARVTGLDLFWDLTEYSPELYARFESNIRLACGEDKITTYVGFSQEELRKLPLYTYDIIYIDGSHAGPHVLEDAVLSLRLLKDGGLIIFDDYFWNSDDPKYELSSDTELRGPKLAIDTFLKFFGEQFQVIYKKDQVMLVKKHS
jgi:predicted O-methyltransferase YrrM